MATNLARRGITMGFDFLERSARFPISESILPYAPSDSFAWAFFAGIGNTLFISAITILIATCLALPLALARRSNHPLALGLSSAFIDVVRNTPLIVQLLFWYSIIIFGLPRSAAALNPLPGVYLSDRGFYLPRLAAGEPHWLMLGLILVAGISAAAWWRKGARDALLARAGLGLIGLLTAMGALASSFALEMPSLGHFNFTGGMTITPEFIAILLGLLVYSTAFIAEIIRGGIDATPHGQWEAGRAIGLNERQTLHEIILPQALRIIIPPMTSQYINIIKNSTLAMIVGYPELNFVTATTINQTGQAVEGVVILMTSFLFLSLLLSAAMNRVDRKLALVTR
ncbi:ABC transporter permease subunit [uncultured Sphingopyxis sp.]|nr:ABC transporter permease subunit [uncultured Sphingopyxis sp.]